MRDVLKARRVDDSVVDTVQLLTSELVTNAVVHARAAPGLLVTLGDQVVRVEVSDGDTTPPTRRRPDLDATSGRGIVIVEGLATTWGVDHLPGEGKRVWFEVPRQGTVEQRVAPFRS